MYDAQAYLHSILYRFEQRIAMLEVKQTELEAENQRLKDQLAGPVLQDLRNQLQAQLDKPTAPPNITYKIQELHVNELKGTLNIGLTSSATAEQLSGMIEQLKADSGIAAENIQAGNIQD